MAFEEGNFGAFDFQDIYLDFADMWGADNHMYDQYKKPLDCFSEIFTQQTVRLNERFLDPSDCSQIKLALICDNCDMDALDCDDDEAQKGCDIGPGEELGAEELTYAPDGCFQSKVATVNQTKCKNRLSFNQKAAFALMKQLYIMDSKLLQLFYGNLAASASDLTLDSGKDVSEQYGLGAIADDVWQLDAAAWDPKILAKFECLVEDCMWTRPMFLTGSIWREFFKLVKGKSGNGCCDYDNLLTNSSIPIKHDIFNFDKAFPGPKTGFLFDASRLAYYNMYRNMNSEPVLNPTSHMMYKWHINSPRHRWTYTGTSGNTMTIPVKYDVYAQWKCIDRDTYGWCWYLEHNGGFLNAPNGNCVTCPFIIQMEQPCVDC